MNLKTSTGYFVPTETSELEPVFKKHLKDTDHFFDLGAGDGRVVDLALNYCDTATGVESDGGLIASYRTFHGNIFNEPLNDFDVLYYYTLGCDAEKELIKKIKNECRDRLILNVTHNCEPAISDILNQLDFELVEKMGNFLVLKRKEDRK